MKQTPFGVAPTINVTPLVDVVLVLLIIFMVVTPLLSKQFWVHLPKKDDAVAAAPSEPPSVVAITVDRAGVVKINREAVPAAELKERLERVLAARPDKIVYFDAEDDAPYGVVVETMDLARRAGASSVAILTNDPVR